MGCALTPINKEQQEEQSLTTTTAAIRRHGLINLWLLVITAGFLAVISVSHSRFLIPQPGSDW
jgi:hypothetical protein